MGINARSPIITGEIEKVYFTIGEVAEAFDVYTSKLRFYDEYFDIGVKKNKIGNRQFTRENIAELKRVLDLSRYCTLRGIALILAGKATFELKS